MKAPKYSSHGSNNITTHSQSLDTASTGKFNARSSSTNASSVNTTDQEWLPKSSVNFSSTAQAQVYLIKRKSSEKCRKEKYYYC